MKWYYWLLTALYCSGIFYLSSKNHIDSPGLFDFPGADKVVHGVEYGMLAALVSVGIRRSNKTVRAAVLLGAPWVFAALYGITDEFHQWFVPGRSCDILDWLADTSGAGLVSWFLCYWVWRVRDFSGEN
jgi:VanZ family protein